MEDPETGELIPSSGRRGRKKTSENESTPKINKAVKDYKALYEEQKNICTEMGTKIKTVILILWRKSSLHRNNPTETK